MKINFLKYNSFLFGYYCFYHVITRIFQIIRIDEDYSRIITFLFLFFIVFEINKINLKFFYFVLFFINLLFFNIILTKASYAQILFHIKDILFYGITAGVIGSLEINKRLINKYLEIFIYLCIGIYSYIVFFDKFIYYKKMGYMVFGYSILQCTIFLSYLIIVSKRRKLLNILMYFYSIILILLFGNRFALVIAILDLLVFYYFFEKSNRKKIAAYILIISLGILFYLNIQPLLILINELFLKLDYRVYGITRLLESLKLNIDSGDVSNGRISIYTEAINIILKNPLGIGIWGYLSEVKSKWLMLGYYPHNIFIEIGMHWGIIGLIVFIIILLKVGYRIITMENSSYKLFLIALILLNTKLLLSDTYISYNMFWMFWAVYFNKSYR